MLAELDPSNRLPEVHGTAYMQVTGQEAARRWAALQLRPEAALLVGRFAVETSELLRVELLRCATAPASRGSACSHLHLTCGSQPWNCSTTLPHPSAHTHHLCYLLG